MCRLWRQPNGRITPLSVQVLTLLVGTRSADLDGVIGVIAFTVADWAYSARVWWCKQCYSRTRERLGSVRDNVAEIRNSVVS